MDVSHTLRIALVILAVSSLSCAQDQESSIASSTPPPTTLVPANPQPKAAGVLIGDNNIKYKVIMAKGKIEQAVGTAVLAGPIIALNTKVAAGAGKLPVIMAGQGALLGSAIAAPIIKGTALANVIATKVAGAIVFVPVAFKTGIKLVAAKTLDIKKQAALNSAAAAAQFGAATKAVGMALLKPIAILEGAKLKMLGKGSAVLGTALKAEGAKMMAKGAAFKLAGAGMKGAGAKMIWWGFGGPKVVGALAAGKLKSIAGLPIVGQLAQ